MEGKGIYTYFNEYQYIGEFKDDKINGKGTFIYKNGKKIKCFWKNGKLVSKKG